MIMAKRGNMEYKFNLPLEGTPQGGLSCRFAAIHLRGDREAVDEV